MSYNGLFNQVDANHDTRIDQGEFSQWASSGFGGVGCPPTVTPPTIPGVNNCPNIVDTPPRPECPPPPTYQTDSSGNYVDPSPRMETRAGQGPPPTYTRNVRIQFYQPPPPPPPGPLTIIEQRPPPQPAPPPHRIRQPPPPAPPPPPPVTVRENPPQVPPPIPPEQKTVMLPPCPPPPRTVITERFEAPPPRPQDVILERWLQYGPRPCRPVRRVRGPCCPPASDLHNVIITYKSQPARVTVNFQRLGVTQADPQAYRQQHGGSLLDSAAFVQRVRSLGVNQDISVPVGSQSASMHGGGFSAASAESSGSVGSYGAFGEFSSSEQSFGGAAVGGGFDVGSAGYESGGSAAYEGAAHEDVGSTMDFHSGYTQ